MHPGTVLLAESTVELGFRKRAGLIFTRGNGPHVGWLGFNTASRTGVPGQIVLNPVVGVRQLPVEEWVARGRGEKVHPARPPTVSEPLRYLLPSGARSDWVLTGDASDRHVVDSVMSAVTTVGTAYIDRMSDLPMLAEVLAAAAPRDQQAAYRWPVALWVSGQRSGALRAALQVQESLGSRSDRAAEELRRFQIWFADAVTAT